MYVQITPCLRGHTLGNLLKETSSYPAQLIQIEKYQLRVKEKGLKKPKKWKWQKREKQSNVNVMATYYAESIWLQDVTVKVEVTDAENF